MTTPCKLSTNRADHIKVFNLDINMNEKNNKIIDTCHFALKQFKVYNKY